MKPLAWLPTLYFTEALPYAVVMTLSTVIYTQMGLSNTDMALYTSWLYLPWVIKPLWSPLIDSFKNTRWWIISMQLLIGTSLACVALSLPTTGWFKLTLAFFWLMAFGSATHDIAADGFYIQALSEKDQAFYVGWRSIFYRIGTFFCQSLLVGLVGELEHSYSIPLAWSISMGLLAATVLMIAFWHTHSLSHLELVTNKFEFSFKPFVESFRAFIHKPQILSAVLFMLLFRLPEAQLAKMSQPFILDSVAKGGLGLSISILAKTYGGLGLIGLILGGIVGGWLVSRDGLKHWWWPMIIAISLPDVVYIYLAYCQPNDLLIINSCVFLEQLGYGFGFTAYMLFLVYFAKGEKSTSVFSICTAFQAAGMMIPGMFSGFLADLWGYPIFFCWITLCCLVTFLVSATVKLPKSE